ncbi:hypothetical protein C8R45DRAFT_944579 [Mycena sanguinolenta]|nr:hypothetical protein C8R45DRAFT_944579 [Mycena sanguinolenta]
MVGLAVPICVLNSAIAMIDFQGNALTANGNAFPVVGSPRILSNPLNQQVTLGFDPLLTFNLTCLDSTTAILQETNSSFALTSWPMETGSTTTPVTYEAFTNRKEQIWKFVPLGQMGTDPFFPRFTPSIFRKGWWEVSEACLGTPQMLCIIILYRAFQIFIGQFSREINGRERRPPIDRWLPVLETRAAGPGIHSTQRYVVAQLFSENDISGPAVLTETETHKKGYMDFSDDLGHLGDV